jgi:hypothetical protein
MKGPTVVLSSLARKAPDATARGVDREARGVLPNFVVIGAHKAGTTSLYAYMRKHPQIFMCTPKEPRYFSAEGNWNRGQEWYQSLFRDAGDAIAIGEASTDYTLYPIHRGVPERMAELIPEARLIYLVRHPLERIRSQYEHMLRLGKENRPLTVAALDDPRYVSCSQYAFQIDQYLEWFQKEQVLVVKSEDIRTARGPTLSRIFEFLGVDPSWVGPFMRREFNPTRKQEPRPLAKRIARLPGYRRVSRAVPPTVKSVYKRIATTTKVAWIAPEAKAIDQSRVRDLASMPEDLCREIESRLADDVVRLRDYLGPQFDGWGIA